VRDAAAEAFVAENARVLSDPELADELRHNFGVDGAKLHDLLDLADVARSKPEPATPSTNGNRADAPSGEDLVRLPGLTYAEARRAAIPERSELVQDLIDLGTVGHVNGLPFARKSFLLQEIARKVAHNAGELVLGRYAVLAGGPVVYAWQDDSTGKMLERIQLGPDYPDELPLRYLLNEGYTLPDDLAKLVALVKHERAVLLILDSLYNFLSPDVKLKDEDVAVVLARVKKELCDPTGCTVAIADHSPWPTENNRGQRRSYGSVFKTAAIRWSIHLEADAAEPDHLYIEAAGNNVAGLKRTPAIFDADAFEIRLLDVRHVDTEALDAAVLEHVNARPGDAQNAIEDAVEGGRQSIRNALERLATLGDIAKGPGRHPRGKYWYPANHQALHSPGDLLATLGDTGSDPSEKGHSPDSPTPRRGGESAGESLEELAEALAERHADIAKGAIS
jgi:hypothetical protein